MAVSYTKTVYVNGSSPDLDATNLNHAENGIDALVTEVNAHTHGTITRDGKIGSTANLPVVTGTAGAVGTITVAAMKTLLGVATFTLTGTSLAITTT